MAFSAEQIKEILAQHGRHANRALGQNFCTDTGLLSACVQSAGFPQEADTLEIGPGLGALTQELLAADLRVTAVEKDAFLADLLPQLFPDPKLTVIHQDILRFPVRQYLPGLFCVAGNLPYYITTAVSEMLLPLFPEILLFMVQKEASLRFSACPGDKVYGPLSIFSQSFYTAECLASVPPDRFYPSPEVDSVIILLKKTSGRAIPDGQDYLKFLHAAFSKRRKTLCNNLTVPGIRDMLDILQLSPSVRAEALTPSQFLRLYSMVKG